MPEGRAPISSSRIATGDIARHSFAIVRRGFDSDEVRAYLQSVSRSIEAFEEREQELRAALAEAEERAAHPIVDEATLTASLGQHSAQILRHAHEEAARIVVHAQEGAATLLRETQRQVDELQANTEASSAERVVEVELLVANAQQEVRAESERILSEAMADGDAIIARAKDEGRALLEQVQEARRRVLADLAARRRGLGIQIEQLRAARDEMAASVHAVRAKVDGILSHLDRTDEEARAAALAIGDQFRLGTAGEPHDQDAAGGVAGEGPGTGPAAADDGGEPGEPGEDESAAPSVDELFARIRAGSGETPPSAEAQAAALTSQVGDATVAPPAGTSGDVAEPAVSPAPEETETATAPTPGPDDALIAWRDELLTPVSAKVSRSLKRALGDEQNRLLALLRGAPSRTADELLSSEDEHLDLYATAARPHLSEAFAAGATFAGLAAPATRESDAVEQSAAALARVVVTMLRRQIAEGSGELADRVGAAFREWRGERVERLAGDYATQAFSAGVTAAGGDHKVRWVVTTDGGCSDCADNALAGAVSANEEFPTGHAHPPAHSGCRCLVAPADD